MTTQVHRGFTLIELVIVVLLLAVLAGGATFVAKGSFQQEAALHIANTQLQSELKALRLEALHSGRRQQIAFSEGTAHYSTFEEDAASDQWQSKGPQKALPEGVTFQSTTLSNKRLSYSNMGQPYNSPSGLPPSESTVDDYTLTETGIIIIEYGATTRTISVSPISGAIYD